MKVPDRIAELIGKELRGNLTAAERMELDQWYLDGEVEIPQLAPARWPSPNFHSLKRKVGLRPDRRRVIQVAGWAAAAVLLFFGWFGGVWRKPSVGTESQVSYEQPFERVENPYGVRRTITLSDGSTVYLNGGSTLAIHRKFSENRVIHLEGEAFFDVKPDSIHPFVVHTVGLETKVLGTSFSVRAFEGEPQFIAVKSGTVSVKDVWEVTRQQELHVNEALEVAASQEFGRVRRINPEETFAWVEGTIIFKQQPIKEVFYALQRWYGLEHLDIQAVNGRCRITGTYSQMSLKEILESITFATGISYELTGKRLTAKDGNC
jgi:transmembrane sensor